MSRTEITKILAEKVMGWEWTDEPAPLDIHSRLGWYKDGQFRGFTFDPFTSSADCDMLVEAFVGKYKPDYFTLAYASSLTYKDGTKEAFAEIGTDCYGEEHCSDSFGAPYTTAKKNEAVAMAIYQAVKDE